MKRAGKQALLSVCAVALVLVVSAPCFGQAPNPIVSISLDCNLYWGSAPYGRTITPKGTYQCANAQLLRIEVEIGSTDAQGVFSPEPGTTPQTANTSIAPDGKLLWSSGEYYNLQANRWHTIRATVVWLQWPSTQEKKTTGSMNYKFIE